MKTLKLKIENYEFEVPVFEQDGKHWAALKPLCDALGVQPARQQERVTAAEFISWRHMYATGSDDKQYQMVCVDIDCIGEWIFGINPNKVKPEIRERMYAFRKKLQAVLYAAVTDHIDINMVATMAEEMKQMRTVIIQQAEHISALTATVNTLVQSSSYSNNSLASIGGKLLSGMSRRRRQGPEVA